VKYRGKELSHQPSTRNFSWIPLKEPGSDEVSLELSDELSPGVMR
jgi:hypothetical protein